MPRYIESAQSLTLPVIPTRGLVAFPSIPMNFEISQESALKAFDRADRDNSCLFLVAVKDLSVENPDADDLYKVGTIVKLKQSIRTPEGNARLMVEGLYRAKVTEYINNGKFLTAALMRKSISVHDCGIKGEALMNETIASLEKMVELIPAISNEIILAARSLKTPGMLADFIASNVLVKFEDKQTVLEAFDPLTRLEKLAVIMESETRLLETERDIQNKVRKQIDDNQRDYYLREQLKIIQNELGDTSSSDTDEYYDKIIKAGLPKEVSEKLLKENDRLAKTPFGSPEATVLRNYLDVCLDIPWTAMTKDRIDIEAAKKILDADHEGLDKVKERILEFLAVKQLNPDIKNQIICLVGPPGVGKSSIAASIARAMKRKYVRVSLGGIRDEADIRGHRKTYIGSMPGRIVNALIEAKVKNPLILLDEIDKLTSDIHGDPASALLEALDPEQNKSFRDHFIELPVDLSECLFITTANTLETVPRPLIDRMEVIELNTYTRTEKIQIAKRHLIPKQLKRHGLSRKTVRITDAALIAVIDKYTREAGVRNLERTIADLCRKSAKKIVEEKLTTVRIDEGDLAAYLGSQKLIPEHIFDDDEVGVVNGLAFTETGGDLLRIEVAILDGTGKLELTGSLGDVMKESARTALSYMRQIAPEMNVNTDFYKNKDIHIHVPEGAVPKDGPSAGVAILVALASALTGMPVRRDVAMTGEITLRGRVLAIGGLKEKTMAAYSAGVKKVLIPKDNLADLEEIDREARENLTFIPCKYAKDALQTALVGYKKEEDALAATPRMPREAPRETQKPIILPNGEPQGVGGIQSAT